MWPASEHGVQFEDTHIGPLTRDRLGCSRFPSFCYCPDLLAFVQPLNGLGIDVRRHPRRHGDVKQRDILSDFEEPMRGKLPPPRTGRFVYAAATGE
jgi:hypothetical protein